MTDIISRAAVIRRLDQRIAYQNTALSALSLESGSRLFVAERLALLRELRAEVVEMATPLHVCGHCGAVYEDVEAWLRLPWKGQLELDGPALELRDCGCGNTIAVEATRVEGDGR